MKKIIKCLALSTVISSVPFAMAYACNWCDSCTAPPPRIGLKTISIQLVQPSTGMMRPYIFRRSYTPGVYVLQGKYYKWEAIVIPQCNGNFTLQVVRLYPQTGPYNTLTCSDLTHSDFQYSSIDTMYCPQSLS